MDSDVKGMWWVTFPNDPDGDDNRYLATPVLAGQKAAVAKAAELARKYSRAGKPAVRFVRIADSATGDVRCGYAEAWVTETCRYVKGDCPRHGTARCVVCGEPSDHSCGHTSQFVCGAALCSNPECATTHWGRH